MGEMFSTEPGPSGREERTGVTHQATAQNVEVVTGEDCAGIRRESLGVARNEAVTCGTQPQTAVCPQPPSGRRHSPCLSSHPILNKGARFVHPGLQTQCGRELSIPRKAPVLQTIGIKLDWHTLVFRTRAHFKRVSLQGHHC